MAPPQLIEEGLFVAAEAFGCTTLGMARLADALGQQLEVVLGGVELATQSVAFQQGRLELGLCAGDVALEGAVLGL